MRDDRTMPGLIEALDEAGGPHAPRERSSLLRALFDAELQRGAQELELRRSGYDEPIVVGFAALDDGQLVGVAPVTAKLRADPGAAPERAWLLAAALTGALVDAGDAEPGLLVGALDDEWLVLALPTGDPELAALAFDEQIAGMDRLRARGLALPGHVLADAVTDLRPPIGSRHPLRIAEAVAVFGGRPGDPASLDEHEDLVLSLLDGGSDDVARPHEDPDPARRVARRILQRLNGMGKWGGYHTEFIHLSRGFAGNERALAEQVGEALLDAGLLAEKRSVGQRHVFLNPRRAGEIHALIERGEVPPHLTLP
jgi:hypothetical protein